MAKSNFDVNKPLICCAIDPGFDSTKVVVNGICFKIPNGTVDVTGDINKYLQLNNNKRAKGYLLSRYIPDKEYIVGDLARKATLEKTVREEQSVRHGMMDSSGRFLTKDFEVHLMTCIGLALVEYSKKSVKEHLQPEINIKNPDELLNCNVIVGIALPNDWVTDVWPDLRKFLIAEHNYSIEDNEGVYNLHFNINEGCAMALSQAVCALLGVTSTDAGVPISDSEVLSNLPCIVIDGGYKTVGMFQLTQALRVSASESNTDFAMGNVHKTVAKILKEEYGRDNIEPFQIPAILEEGGVINYLEDTGNGKEVSKQVDVKLLVEEEMEKTCRSLIKLLNDKFEKLLDTKEVVITGGTGAAYFRHLSKYLEEERGHLKGHIILTSYEFLGKKIDPVYAIAVGMYKTLRQQLSAQSKKKTSENKQKD